MIYCHFILESNKHPFKALGCPRWRSPPTCWASFNKAEPAMCIAIVYISTFHPKLTINCDYFRLPSEYDKRAYRLIIPAESLTTILHLLSGPLSEGHGWYFDAPWCGRWFLWRERCWVTLKVKVVKIWNVLSCNKASKNTFIALREQCVFSIAALHYMGLGGFIDAKEKGKDNISLYGARSYT